MTAPASLTPRARVETALRHEQPDRTPVDFLATTEVWARMIDRLNLEPAQGQLSDFMDPKREALLHDRFVEKVVVAMQADGSPERVLRPRDAGDVVHVRVRQQNVGDVQAMAGCGLDHVSSGEVSWSPHFCA